MKTLQFLNRYCYVCGVATPSARVINSDGEFFECSYCRTMEKITRMDELNKLLMLKRSGLTL